jgi:hypothetical protein
MRDLRAVCETVFDLMLVAYVSSLEASRNRSANRGVKEGKPGKSLEKWEEAIKSGNEALTMCRDAEMKRQANDIKAANVTVKEGVEALRLRCNISTCSRIETNQVPLDLVQN